MATRGGEMTYMSVYYMKEEVVRRNSYKIKKSGGKVITEQRGRLL